jgi:hypothetical protein
MSTTQYPRLIDQLQIKHEPRGLLGRFHLLTENEFAARGFTLHLAPIDELWRAYERQPETWNGLAPLLDTRLVDIPADEGAAHLVHNKRGDLVAICSARLIDLKDSSLQDACDNLSFFFGTAAHTYKPRFRCELTAPSARRTFGRLVFVGGMWIDPRYRGHGLGFYLQDLSRFYGLTQWQVDHEMIVLSSKTFKNTLIRERYHFSRYEQGLTLFVDDKPLMANGVICLSTVGDMHGALARLIAEHEEAQSIGRRDDQQSVATG